MYKDYKTTVHASRLVALASDNPLSGVLSLRMTSQDVPLELYWLTAQFCPDPVSIQHSGTRSTVFGLLLRDRYDIDRSVPRKNLGGACGG
jgi:hypothetical protein